MSKHTPSPWAPGHPDTDDDKHVVCSLSEGWSVVALEADPNEYEPEADAILIAAAPELLEAAEIIEKRIAYYASLYENDIPNIEEWGYTDKSGDMAKLRSAIAKAKGEKDAFRLWVESSIELDRCIFDNLVSARDNKGEQG